MAFIGDNAKNRPTILEAVEMRSCKFYDQESTSSMRSSVIKSQ